MLAWARALLAGACLKGIANGFTLCRVQQFRNNFISFEEVLELPAGGRLPGPAVFPFPFAFPLLFGLAFGVDDEAAGQGRASC